MERDPDAYVYLKNRLFVNRKMIEMGLAVVREWEHRYKERFSQAREGFSTYRLSTDLLDCANRVAGHA
ncbi:MAG: hypothetical protein RML92_08775 [Bacteroidia bacterium]|nr:hypothetical protein [Bacteroidia bacterium]